MSRAKPMGIGRRVHLYMEQAARASLTGRQWQRHRHKYARKYGKPLYGHGGKDTPTPRQYARKAAKP